MGTSKTVPLSVPVIRGNEWKYIKDCLDTGWVSSVGSYVQKFENAVAGYLGSPYAVATVNGTSALHVSILACDVKPGDEVIVPALTFIASVNTVRYSNASPVFMDCDSKTLCIDTEKVIEFIKNHTLQKKDGFSYNKNSKRRIKAIIPVHIFGHPVDMDRLIEICKKRNIEIIEDATESLGSEYKNGKTGTFGKTGCFSFNGNKIITTGGGGMVVTNNRDLAKKIKHLTTQANTGAMEYDYDEIGYNYRLTNIQAAMGLAQMEKLQEYIDIKRNNALLYKKLLSKISGVEYLWEKPWAKSNFWFYTIKVKENHRNPLLSYLLDKNIEVRPLWKPICTLPMYKGCQAYKVAKAIAAYNRSINLPCSINLSSQTIEYVVRNIRSYFKG